MKNYLTATDKKIESFIAQNSDIVLSSSIHTLSENELQFIKDLDNFLNNKGKILKFRPHFVCELK